MNKYQRIQDSGEGKRPSRGWPERGELGDQFGGEGRLRGWPARQPSCQIGVSSRGMWSASAKRRSCVLAEHGRAVALVSGRRSRFNGQGKASEPQHPRLISSTVLSILSAAIVSQIESPGVPA